MTQASLHLCKNCGDVIGHLEPPAHWHGHRVCALCFAKLSRAATIAPGANPAPSPHPIPAAPPPQFPDGIDLQLLKDLTGQTDVKTVAHAFLIRDTATKAYSKAKSLVFDSRVKTATQRLRFAEARIGISPAIDAVLVASVPTLFTAVCLIFLFSPSLAVLGVILAAVYLAGITAPRPVSGPRG
jgi:hypothetical protein